jgi:porphobilinogen synthase
MFDFPKTHRSRRLRTTPAMRNLVRETTIDAGDFIYPLFAVPGSRIRREIASMPGVFHLSVDEVVREAALAASFGISGVLLFGLPPFKDDIGSGAWASDGIVQQGVAAVKRELPHLLVITDVCLCEYTSHGHCGVLANDTVDNDKTLDLLGRTAVSHAAAGADMVAPSDMMDFRIAALREALDRENFTQTSIMSYAAKYASAFYGPFREAADSAPSAGDRRGYQMDGGNRREALKEVAQDIAEGADIVMVKPALSYLDIIRDVRNTTNLPVAAYNISGEYSMVKAAAKNGWIDERAAALEILTGIKRAGADIIITYHALDASKWLAKG